MNIRQPPKKDFEKNAPRGQSDEDVAEQAAAAGIAVVGLGGSAGALEAFKVFFEAMPADSGAAFVVIQHLAPDHDSLLPELLAAHTKMKVAQARDGMAVEPDRVYVIPPNQDLGIRDGVLHLAAPVKTRGIPMPIDFFFRSLAEDRQERAVCILFSGAGSDGTLGVRAVRGAGGLTLAQDPQTAQYGDMPRSAIATKLVDRVLPPEQMPGVVAEYLRQPYVRGEESPVEADGTPGGFNEILAIVRQQTGCDFRCYKKHTILRRIERRMGLRHLTDITQYCKQLGADAGEVGQLLKDLLINVTAFFRDAAAFEELQRKVIAPLIAAKPADEALRVWVAGCATGEEAYSLAMLLMEEMAAARKNIPLQIFATDIDEEALQFARQGLYPESIVADMDPERLAKFFIKREQGFQVVDSLRNAVVFAVQNLIADPPFSRMDLITCRNLLIYLDAETQAKLIPLFNFALVPGGYLFLGKSEGVGNQSELFSQVSKKARLYRRLTLGRPIVLDSPVFPGKKKLLPATGVAAKPPSATYADAIRQALLSHFTASVVLVGARGQILQFYGQAGKYLDMPAAEPNLNLLDIAKEGLSLRLRSALHTANEEKKTVVLDGVPVTRDAGGPCARVTVAPVARRGETETLLAVIFEDVSRPALAAIAMPDDREGAVTVRQLEDELRITQQDLQAANEEMRISNEEVVSTNEELQSTNEELETSKEELQSVNEELTTVNSQLQEKVEQLDVSYNDMANLLKSTRIATLFLDENLRIKFFTPATTQVLKLIASDTGRPLSDLSISFVDYDLTADARAVAQGGPIIERDVRHADGSYYMVRVMPYHKQHDRVDGVVVTFDDVTRLRRSEERTIRLAAVVADSNDAVALFDSQGKIQAWNRGAQNMYGWREDEALRMNIHELVPVDRADDFSRMLQRLLAGETIEAFETRHRTKNNRLLDVWLTATVVRDEAQNISMIATTARDITERKRKEDEIHKLNRTLLALSLSDRALMHIRDEKKYLADVCQIIVQNCGHAMVWIGYAGGDAAKTVQPVASAGFEEGYLETMNITWADDERGRGPTGSAIRTGRPCVCANMLTDPNLAPWREEAVKRGYASSLVVPLLSDTSLPAETAGATIVGGKAFGALTIYAREPDAFTADEVELLVRLADDLTHGITLLRLREAGRQTEHEREITVEFLRQVNAAKDTTALIQVATGFFHARSGCEAVGIRLRQGDDYPYFETRGFSKEFVKLENSLCARDAAGNIMRDAAGYPVQACMCGNVIQGRFDPAKPFFTARGNFWTNGTTTLLATTTEAERQARTRNRCNGEGYESVALIALRVGDECLGLLQLNDKRKDRFSAADIALWESLSDHLATALARTRAEDALRRNARRDELLSETAAQLLLTGDPLGLVESLCRKVMSFLDCDAFINFIADEQAGKLRLNACAGVPDDAAKKIEWLDYGVAVCGCAARDRQRIVAENIATTPDPRTDLVRGFGIQAYCCHPLVVEETVIGTLSFGARTRTHFSADDLSTMKTVADLVAVAMARVKNEQDLRASEERSRLAQEAAELEIWDFDPSQGVLQSSPQVKAWWCLPPEQPFTFDVWKSRLHPADRDAIVTEVYRSMDPDGTGRQDMEYRVVNAAGAVRWISVHAVTHFDEVDGKRQAVRMVGTMQDVTARKQAKADLTASQERLQMALTSAGMASFDWDIVTNRRTWSREVHRLLGTSPETFTGTTGEFFQIVHPDDRPVLQAAIDRALKTDNYESEYRAVWPDGSVHHISAKGKVYRDHDGKPVRMSGICWDQSKRREAEETLRRAHERLALAQRAAAAGAWEWDLTADKLNWSPELFQLFGLDSAKTEANLDTWRAVLHPDDRQKAEETLRFAIRDHLKVVNEYRVVLPSGETRWILANGETTYDETGRAVRMAGLCFDITARKTIEETLRRHTEELTRFNRAMVDRELRMIELKKEVNDRCVQLGQKKPYLLDFEKEKR